ncbi:MAG: hypothetical protein L3J83_06695, partial [Proteobacteria bacterium]|nr:hypothetical protein [Pseudomonadota bacterium]
ATNVNDGYYQFSPLASGMYCVEFSNLPAGFVFTEQNQGGDDAVDSDADTVTGQVQNINLVNNDSTIDAGVYAPLGSISGSFYCDDSPQNGMFDSGEEVSNITVSLSRDLDCDDAGDVFIASLDTDVMGDFQFSNLPVAFSPAPPNPLVCYVIDYDPNGLAGCSIPITPVTQVTTLSTNTPVATPIVFGVMPILLVPIPVNSWWALLLLVVGILISFRMRKSKA